MARTLNHHPRLLRRIWPAALALALCGIAVGLLLRGQRLVASLPRDGARDVSTRATLRATLARAPAAEAAAPILVLEPAVEGELRVEGRELTFVPAEALAPDTTYTVRLPAWGLAWRFTTAPRRVLYLAPDAEGLWQIHALELQGEEPVALTAAPWGVRDYAVAPDGEAIAYAAEREDGGHDLWLVARDGGDPRLLQGCPGASCREATWLPDGSGLVYERHEAGEIALWVATLDGETRPLLWDQEPLAATAPRLSPDGRWLAALCASTGQMLLYDMAAAEGDLIPGQAAPPAAWRPRGTVALMSYVQWLGESFGMGLLQVDLDAGELALLTGDTAGGPPLTEDAYPAWSPDGEWVAFGRRAVMRGAISPRQLWLMDAQGQGLRPLTADDSTHHGAPQWSPDGRLLLYSRHDWQQPEGPLALGVLELATGDERLLPAAGNWPSWLP